MLQPFHLLVKGKTINVISSVKCWHFVLISFDSKHVEPKQFVAVYYLDLSSYLDDIAINRAVAFGVEQLRQGTFICNYKRPCQVEANTIECYYVQHYSCASRKEQTQTLKK